MEKQMLIAVEGIDGSGKTTIARRIVEKLKEMGYDAVYFQEPTEGKYGRILRESQERFGAEEELKLFLLDRKEDVERNILPALKSGKIVVMDRYYLSNIAYQSVRGIKAEKIKRLNEEIAPKPDLVILLDVDPELAVKRVRKRGKLSPFEDVEYLRKVREAYLKNVGENSIVVDASRPLRDVENDVLKAVLNFIRSKAKLSKQ